MVQLNAPCELYIMCRQSSIHILLFLVHSKLGLGAIQFCMNVAEQLTYLCKDHHTERNHLHKEYMKSLHTTLISTHTRISLKRYVHAHEAKFHCLYCTSVYKDYALVTASRNFTLIPGVDLA